MSNVTQNVSQKKIYSFWQNIPLIKRLSEELYNQIKQETRLKIMDILRTGIEDEASQYKKRYALTANEIQKILIKEGINTSLQNTYFHINILVKEGFIEEIEILKEGRFNKRYYGRTAKFFLFGSYAKNLNEDKFKIKLKLMEIIKLVNPESDQKEIEKTIDDYLKEKVEFYMEIENKSLKWFEQNAKLLIDSNLDVIQTYDLIFNLILKGVQTSLSEKMIENLKVG